MIQGTAITVALETDVAKNGGGTYKGWEVVYKTPDGKVQTLAKPIQGLRFNAALKKQLEDLKPGDFFTSEQEKNAAGFLDVKNIIKGGDGSVSAPSAPREAVAASGGAKGNAYQASSYPTKDEREATQNHIIRQSSLAQAVATLAIGGKAVKPADVLAVANEYVDWVKFKPTGQEALQEMENDFPD